MPHPHPSFKELSPRTVVVAAGRPEWDQGAPVNPPVILSSTFISRGVPTPGEPSYARYDNPAHHAVEQVIGLLEGADRSGVLFASGMAAIDAALSLIPSGGRLVVPAHAYNGTTTLAQALAQDGRIRLSQVAIDKTEEVVEALKGGAGAAPAAMLWIETPTNPLMEVADGPALIEAAKAVGAIVAVDNTLATPLGQRPLDWGADLVVHSASKFLGGHSDLIMGAVCAASAEHDSALRDFRRIHGATPSGFDAFLLLRGIRTVALRLDRINASAATLARRLDSHPAVDKIHYPGLETDPGYALAKTQMRGGAGGVIAIEVRGGADAADLVAEYTKIWAPATSLGGVESMLERRQRWPGEFAAVPANLVRLSVGIEDVDELWADLDQALTRACEPK
ncbi:MAG: PLP-dependent aspartate aminotransferase family protein [Bifidobacteriaceae bacterium]|jgi:cystathionine gamma-synthase|nr:PLP-dependent aspartate aminotransferase family protein [Bifidobacteriaceae bacterium]